MCINSSCLPWSPLNSVSDTAQGDRTWETSQILKFSLIVPILPITPKPLIQRNVLLLKHQFPISSASKIQAHIITFHSINLSLSGSELWKLSLSQTCLSPVFAPFSGHPLSSGVSFFSPCHLPDGTAMEDLWLEIILSGPDMWPPQLGANEWPL